MAERSNPAVTFLLASIALCAGVYLAIHFDQQPQPYTDPIADAPRPTGSGSGSVAELPPATRPPKHPPPLAAGSGKGSAKPTPPVKVVTPPRPPEGLDVAEVLAQIDGFVRAFRLEKAAEELAELASLPLPSADRARVDARRAQVDAYLALLDRLAKAVGQGPLKGYPLTWSGLGRVLRLSGADRKGFRAKLGTKPDAGEVGEKWANLPVAIRFRMFGLLDLSPDEGWTLSALFADLDSAAMAEKSLIRVWLSAKDQRPRVVARVSELRGKRGSYVVYRRQFVTATEKEQLARGLVLEGDEWITKAERRHRRKGHQKIGGKYVPLTAEQLRAKGYVEQGGKWITRKAQTESKGQWENAWERRTAHFLLKTNHSERFADRTAVALESAYAAMEKHFGGAPKGSEPLRILGFKHYEDFRAYCQKVGATAQLNAAGFCPSERRTCCGWDKLKDRRSFLRTLVHESCHLFHLEMTRRGVPSWIAEGMATYFEGFDADGKGRLRFHHKPNGRRRMLKASLGTDAEITLKEMPTLRASTLINSNARKSLNFYATAWGYYYFFAHTPNRKYREGFLKYRTSLEKGGRPDLAKLLGADLDKVHADFVRFIKKN